MSLDNELEDAIINAFTTVPEAEQFLKMYGTDPLTIMEIGVLVEEKLGALGLIMPTAPKVAHGIMIGLFLRDYLSNKGATNYNG